MPSAPAAPKKPRPVAADSGIRSVYSYDITAEQAHSREYMFALELKCYRENVLPAEGGLGSEQHFKNAWAIMWPEYEWSDWSELQVWAWCKYKYISIIGHRRAGKTFNASHIAWLDYCANPYETLTNLTTVTFEGLKLRMWSDLMLASETAKMKQPFRIRNSTNEMRVYPQEVSAESGEKYQIHGMAVDRSKDAAGRIKGAHAPRVRLMIDEAENMPPVIYDAMGNPMSAPDAKCFMLFNPVEWVSRAGQLCEPKAGRGSVTDTDLFWETKLGVCIHFDGLQSPNFRQTKKVFEGLLRPCDAEEVRVRWSEDSVEWWSQIRGYFPPDGLVSRIFPSQVIEKGKSAIIFDFQTDPCATLDPAFEADDCVIHFGAKGNLRDGRKAISANQTEVLKLKTGAQFEPKDYQIAHQVMERCRLLGVKPENFIMDKSGGGRGVYAILQKEWSPLVQGIDYGGAATERPLRSDESDKCCDIYEYFVTELWFRGRAAIEDGILGGLAFLNPLTIDDLFARQYFTRKKTQGTVQIAEQKSEMKKRIGRSPDCFVAGTMVLTPDGERPIEFIRFGDLVSTPMGDFPVIKTHCVETDAIYSIQLPSGATLSGKPKHRIFTWNRGWVSMDALNHLDEMEESDRLWRWKLLNLFFTPERSIGFKHLADIIRRKTGIRRRDFYTEWFGVKRMGKFLKECAFTTEMEIGEITTSPILNSWSAEPTRQCTSMRSGQMESIAKKASSTSVRCSRKQRSGTDPMKDEHGMLSTERTRSEDRENQWKRNAFTVESHSKPKLRIWQNTALRLIGRWLLKFAFTKKSDASAPFAETDSGKGPTLMGRSAHQDATRSRLEPSNGQSVYNLTLLEHNVFYANGVLVENCGDAFVQFAELLIREGHGPGRLKPVAGVSTRWQRQRSRAVKAGQRHSEKTEYSFQ